MIEVEPVWRYFLLSAIAVVNAVAPSVALPLSPGDRIEVSIPEEKYFARVYEVNEAGELEVPYLGNMSVVGLEPKEVEAKLTQALIEEGYFPPNKLQLSVQTILWAPVAVGISGEVYAPGQRIINESAEDDRVMTLESGAVLISGDFPPRRTLTQAIRAAGGVTPTADISHVKLIRGSQETIIDLSGVFTGAAIENLPLIAGDQVIIPTANRFQPELVRPTDITLPGIKIFVSNLSVPADRNSGASVNNQREGVTFPYGARFSQAVFSSNCVGGTKSINANRKAILSRVNRITGKTAYLERSIEDLIRHSTSETDNPFLMPRDAVACYDSKLVDRRDVFRSISEFWNPVRSILDFIF